jgi:hypothetical protein
MKHSKLKIRLDRGKIISEVFTPSELGNFADLKV